MTPESLDCIISTCAKSTVDGPSESKSDGSHAVMGDRSGCGGRGTGPGGVAATKPCTKTASGDSDARDIVARIYREELQKLAAAAKTNGNFAEYIMYEGELERLTQSSTTITEPVSSPTPPRRRKDGRSSKRSAGRNRTPQTVVWSAVDSPVTDHPEDLTTRSSQCRGLVDSRGANSTSQFDGSVPHSAADLHCERTTMSADLSLPDTVPNVSQPDIMEGATVVKLEECSAEIDFPALKADEDCSPLDLMRTIADSVSSKSQKKSAAIETARYALPPITTEQLKRCSYLNTDEVVATVRTTLADYSISQRLFGEAVLGLSQASTMLLAIVRPLSGTWPKFSVQVTAVPESCTSNFANLSFILVPDLSGVRNLDGLEHELLLPSFWYTILVPLSWTENLGHVP